jgi:hypothetical protein
MRIGNMLHLIVCLSLMQTRDNGRIAICRDLFNAGEGAQMATNESRQSNAQYVL